MHSFSKNLKNEYLKKKIKYCFTHSKAIYIIMFGLVPKEGQINVLLEVAQDKGQSALKQDCPS